MSAMEIDSLWTSAFDEGTIRPVIYSSEKPNEEGWRPLTEPQEFIRNLTTLNHQQLYAASSNNQIAMKRAQDEYLDIERQIAAIKGRETIKNPQSLLELDVFEERKESSLYGYKYDANRPALLQAGHPGHKLPDDLTEREKHDVRLLQEPFEQGGFVPKEREYKLIVAKAKDPKNVDGWEPVIKNGRRFIPKQQTHVDEYNITYVKRNVDANGEIIRPVSPDGSDVTGGTPDKVINKRLTRTRFDGKKVPPTRDVSEVPSGASTPRGRKRGSPFGEEYRDDTPTSKRQKVNTAVNGQDLPKPKHANQWTKRNAEKERVAGEQGSTATTTVVPQTIARIASSSTVSWRDLSADAKYSRTWTNAELHEAVREDHSWLNPDPAKADVWAKKLLANDTPIRSFAMYKKWRFWQETGMDKRPRNKNVMNDGITNKENEEYTPSQKIPRKAGRPRKAKSSEISTPAIASAATTPAATPAPEVSESNGSQERLSTLVENWKGGKALRTRGLGSGTLRQKAMQEEKEKRNGNDASNARQESTDLRSSSRKARREPSPPESTIEVNGNVSGRRRPSLRKQESESTIVVSTSAARSTLDGISPRRSARVLRRPSA